MKKLLSMMVALLMATTIVPPSASAYQATSTARYYDVQRLQDDLYLLEDALSTLPTSDRRYRDFDDRANALRREIDAMKGDVDGGRSVSRAAVERLRTRIHDLHGEIDTALNRGYNRRSGTGTGTGTGASFVLPVGTDLSVRLENALSSRTAHVEDRFEATVARPVYVDGRIVVPDGSRVQGTVTDVQQAQRPARGGRLNLAFNRLILDDGTTVDLSARLVQVKENFGSGASTKKGAIGAAVGGILGSVLGGTKGAIVGAVIGGAGGAVSSTGDDVELPSGTVFDLELEREASTRR